jgi:hypothetical protein
MTIVKLVLPIKKNIEHELVIEISEHENWDDLEYIFAQTDIFQDWGLYYHGAKLWHLVDKLHFDVGTFIDKNEKIKNITLNSNINIFLVWEEDEAPDSP